MKKFKTTDESDSSDGISFLRSAGLNPAVSIQSGLSVVQKLGIPILISASQRMRSALAHDCDDPARKMSSPRVQASSPQSGDKSSQSRGIAAGHRLKKQAKLWTAETRHRLPAADLSACWLSSVFSPQPPVPEGRKRLVGGEARHEHNPRTTQHPDAESSWRPDRTREGRRSPHG